MNTEMMIDYMVQQLYDIIEEEGLTEYRTLPLLKDLGYQSEMFENTELFEIHDRLIEILKEEGRDPETENAVVGMPYAVTVFLKKRKCPYCGSRDIAKIIYGYPVMSEEMEEEIKQGKIVLGGCLLREEKYCCNSCDRKF